MERPLSPVLVGAAALFVVGCALSHGRDAPTIDASTADASIAWPVCRSREIVARWVSEWSVPAGSLATVPGDGFYVEDHHEAGRRVVRRLDPSGAWSIAATLPEDGLPIARLFVRDGELWLARWGNPTLQAGPVRASGGAFEPAWEVPIESSISTIGALDAERFVALSNDARSLLSSEIFGADGRVLRRRAPLPVDGGGSLVEGAAGPAMIAVISEGRLFVGDAEGPFEPLGAVCPSPFRCDSDVLPLGGGAFAWAWVSDEIALVEVRSSGSPPRRIELPPVPRIAHVALGAGPDDTILVALSREHDRMELRALDAATLAEVASGELAPEGAIVPHGTRITELSRTHVGGVFAVRAQTDIPDGHAERWALALACGP
jgi:hypothetical protein